MKKQFLAWVILLVFGGIVMSCSSGEDVDKNSVTDIDGNVYPTINLGKQTWMSKNLEVSHYRNGDPIPEVQDWEEWKNLTTGAWCYYEINSEYGPVYGKLYNWYAVNDTRGLIPEGWHVPTDAEWTTLTNYLGGTIVAGGAMKDISLWESPNTGATNSSGFTALPGGCRLNDGSFTSVYENGFWWSTSEKNTTSTSFGIARYISFFGEEIKKDVYIKQSGFSVRCVKIVK